MFVVASDPRVSALTDVILAMRPDYSREDAHRYAFEYAKGYPGNHLHYWYRPKGCDPLTTDQRAQMDAAHALLFT